MPDYAQMYRHGLRVSEKVPGIEAYRAAPEVLDPEKRYSFDFTSVPVEGQRIAQPQMPQWREFTTTNDRAEYDYKTGQLSAQNEYLEEMKAIEPLKGFSEQPSDQYTMLSQMAAQKLMAKNAEMNSGKQKWENTKRRLRSDPRWGTGEIRQAESDWYSKNPIFETEEINIPAAGVAFQRPPKQLKPPSRGRPLAVSRIVSMADRAIDKVVSLESWWPGVGTSKENLIKAVLNEADIAGWKDLNQATKEALFAALDAKMKKKGETKDVWDDDAIVQIREYIGLEEPSAPSGKVRMQAPDGKVWEIDSSEIEEALANGYKAI